MGAPLAEFTQIQNSAGKAAYTASKGFLSDGINPLNLPSGGLGKSQSYVGICGALYPIEWPGPKVTSGTAGIYQSANAGFNYFGGGVGGQYITYRLQYRDPNPQDPAGSWETYDEKYNFWDCLFLGTPFGSTPGNLTDSADGAQGGDWEGYVDPRTSRFAGINGVDFEGPVQTPGGTGVAQEWADQSNGISVTDRPDFNAGFPITNDRTLNGSVMGGQYVPLQATGWTFGEPYFHLGLLSQNSPTVKDNGVRFTGDIGKLSVGVQTPGTYYADPDGVVRGAMGVYNLVASATNTAGLPLTTAYNSNNNPMSSGNPNVGPPKVNGNYQGQSRPYMLHRPFRSVGELGYVFSGTPWKNIDFFTPESGDAALLDVFTAYETPAQTTNSNPLVAGVVNLNTQQPLVLQAILAGASVDEAQSSGTASTNFPAFSLSKQQWNNILPSGANGNTVLANVANNQMDEVPAQNVSELVGRWVASSGTYSGLSGDLTNTYASFPSLSGSSLETMQNVDRFRESFIRPLASVGNTRVWNLMIDLVVQNGQYNSNATTLDNFTVSGEQRYWVHEAIDRYTGQILDQNVESVGPGPDSLSLTASTIPEGMAAGTTVGTLGAFELSGVGHYRYALVSGSDDDASFAINGNALNSAGVFNYLAKSTYNLLVKVTDQNGLTYTEPLTVTVQPAPYTEWKIENFGGSASDASVAGDLADAQNDGLPNLLKYALGKSPNAPATTGITVKSDGTTLTMYYTRASAATDVTVDAAVTTDPTNAAGWSSSGVTQTMLTDNGTIQQWQATAPENAANALFMRLTVTHPAP